jgi:3'-phosphoadenosine 5'-phosphosulfate sulfotransferase (PAPS reductase)/FAD synthetase
MPEPILRPSDHATWARWRAVCLAHARTLTFGRKVERARAAIRHMLATAPRAEVAWSAGKDSTALAHLCAQEGVTAAKTIRDDLDFGGEDTYITQLATEWGMSVTTLRPSVSAQEILKTSGGLGDDMHSRTADLAAHTFFDLVDQHNRDRDYPGVYLGLRVDESPGRAKNFWRRGEMYERSGGDGRSGWVCQPLALWSSRDVWAYLHSRHIPAFHVYRCVGLHHQHDPGSLRLDGWAPGPWARYGWLVWLRYYYPSIHARLVEIMPDARGLA